MSGTSSPAPQPGAGGAASSAGAGQAGAESGTSGTLLTNGANGTAPHVNGAANGNGAADRSWLPEAYRADPTFQDLKDLDGLAKSYKHAASLVGIDRGQVIRLPTSPDAPEWSDVWARLGRPENAEGYKITAPAGMDDATLTAFRATAHRLGISNDQAASLMEFYGGSLTALQERDQAAAAVAQADTTNALRREWGLAYDDQLHSARRAVREVGGDAMLKLLEDTRLGDHPDVVRMFAKMGERLAEPNGLKGGGGTMQMLTPASAQAEIRALQADKGFATSLSDRQHPGYKAARERWDALHLAAYPQEPPR